MNKILVKHIIILAFFALIFGCEKDVPECPVEQAYYMNLSIVNSSDSINTSISFYHPDLNPEEIFSIESVPDQIFIPVNMNSNTTEVLIDYENSTDTSNITIFTDTLTFSYNLQPNLEFAECGFIMEFELLSANITKNYTDSVFITNNLINGNDEHHIEIYY